MRLSKNASLGEVNDAAAKEGADYLDNVPRIDAVKAVLVKAARSGLLVMVGGGSGNNTAAAIVAVADVKNREFVRLLNSNFGSDDN